MDSSAKVGRIGAEIGTGKPIYRIEHITPWTQIVTWWTAPSALSRALIHSKQTGVGLKDLSGPPGILAMLAAYVNSDWRLALSFLVLLNINLAIINLFPMPVLDGGHIVMALVERLFGRPLPHRLVEYTTTAFAVLLISFMLYVSYNDVRRFSCSAPCSSKRSRSRSRKLPPAGAPLNMRGYCESPLLPAAAA